MSQQQQDVVQLVDQGDLKRQLKATIAHDIIHQKLEKEVTKLAKQGNLKGYRKGKIPLAVIRRQYGQQLRQQVISETIEASFKEAVDTHKLALANQPELTIDHDKAGEDLAYHIAFEVFPAIELMDLAELKLVKPAVSLEAKTIDEAVDKLRQEHCDWQVVTRKAVSGDQVIVDYVGTLDGEPFAGGTGEQQEFVLGGGRMLEDFEKPIIGHSAGEEVVFPLTFPDEYHADLAGKQVEFTVKVREVAEAILPEIDEAFIRRVGVESGTREDFDQEIETTLKTSVAKQLHEVNYFRAGEALRKKCKFLLPESLVEQEKKRLLDDRNQRENTSHTLDDLSRGDRKKVEKKAEMTIAFSLLFQKVVETYEIALDPAKFQTHIQSMALPYVDQQQFMSWFFSDENRVNQAKAQVLEQQAVAKVFELAATKTKTVAYEDVDALVNKERAAYE